MKPIMIDGVNAAEVVRCALARGWAKIAPPEKLETKEQMTPGEKREKFQECLRKIKEDRKQTLATIRKIKASNKVGG